MSKSIVSRTSVLQKTPLLLSGIRLHDIIPPFTEGLHEPVSQKAQGYGVTILALKQVRDLNNELIMEFGKKR